MDCVLDYRTLLKCSRPVQRAWRTNLGLKPQKQENRILTLLFHYQKDIEKYVNFDTIFLRGRVFKLVVLLSLFSTDMN
jgi:hypothetical protein